MAQAKNVKKEVLNIIDNSEIIENHIVKEQNDESFNQISEAEKLYIELEKKYGALVAWYFDSVLKHFTRLSKAQLCVYLNCDNIFNVFSKNFYDVIYYSLMTLKITAEYSGKQFSNSTTSQSFDNFIKNVNFSQLYNTNHHEIFEIDNKITYFDRNGSLYSLQRKIGQ